MFTSWLKSVYSGRKNRTFFAYGHLFSLVDDLKRLPVSQTTTSNCFKKCGSRVEQQEAVADNSEGDEDFSGWDKFMRNLEDGPKQ